MYCVLLIAAAVSEAAKSVAKKTEKKGKKAAAQAEPEVSCFICVIFISIHYTDTSVLLLLLLLLFISIVRKYLGHYEISLAGWEFQIFFLPVL